MNEVDTGVWVRLGAGDGDEVGVWVGALVRVGDVVRGRLGLRIGLRFRSGKEGH